ncbi:LacI family transcriptional regulator [Lactiplantibacillus garii]|uniref:LacI family transcriptional regulator n=1 Tax=Lactiplantibacillus garii TaxID=2306423 RepID=A0A3R8KK19_9LACO|nr:LacI family DNA-binding transcriptional regulator [Lactiplantibacillus garii]RRK09595.1 LacI family transcriptional regulator [Lactiplantibacillus garii]
MANKITIRDVAQEAGVSVTTVSQILNNKGDRFSSLTQQKVRAARKRLNYIPDFNAQYLIRKSSRTIGVLIPDISNPFFSQFITGIQNKAMEMGYVPLIFGFNNNSQRASKYLEELIKRAADGMIIASDILDTTDIDKILKDNHIPYILLDRSSTSVSDSDHLMVDDYNGGQQVAQFLIEQGHQHLAVVMPESASVNIQRRWEGFYQVVEAHQNVSVDRVFAPLSKVGGRQAAQAVIKLPNVTGLFAINDEVAMGIYRGLEDHGKQIPVDYSVIGFDDIDIDQYMKPTLTTVHQPILRLGEQATEMVISRIESPSKPVQSNKLPVELIIRESTNKR